MLTFFEPWDGYPAEGDIPSLTITDDLFYMQLVPEFAWACEASGGIVRNRFP